MFVGAQIVGINCHFDPETCVKTVKMMKEGVEKAGLKAHYMSQPLAYHTPDCNCQGFIDLPEFPFSMYTRSKTPHYSLLLICWPERQQCTHVQLCVLQQVWSPGSWPDGTCRNTPGKRTTLEFVTSEAAAGLNPITSVPWLRSWHLRGVSFLLARRSMATGAVAWRCTQSLGSEPGRDLFISPPIFSYNIPSVWVKQSVTHSSL